jgi:cupin superfamily acireductone dioxygenase involved in methionine salvage
MANLKKKEKLYSAMYYLSVIFTTYHIELLDLMNRDDETCAELKRLERAIDDVVKASGIKLMSDRQKIEIMRDHEKLKELIDTFMRM